MPETIFIVIAHIEDDIIICLPFIQNLFKLFWGKFFFVFFDFFFCDFFSEDDDFMADFDGEFWELMTCDKRCFWFYISNIFEILRRFEIHAIRSALTEIARNSRANAFCAHVDPSFESDIRTELEVVSTD